MSLIEELLDIAGTAARESAAFLLDGWAQRKVVDTKSSGTDVVTQMDRGSEEMLVGIITGRRPDDAVLGEEGGRRTGTSAVEWIIDPLDGTVNYLYGLPVWAVSVGAVIDGHPSVGVVAAPALGTTWTGVDAGSERWAAVDGEPMHVGACRELGQALLGTGFGYRAQVRARQGEVLRQVVPEVRDVRRAGSAAIDMCWVAQGALDAYYERGTHEWDRAAATAIVRGAGGVVGGLGDRPAGEDMVVASNPGLWEPLQGLLLRAGAGGSI